MSALPLVRAGVFGLATLLATLVALWVAPLGGAFEDPDEKPAPLGLYSLKAGQTLRVSIANVVGFDPQPDPPGVTCSFEVGFVDADNRAIGNPNIFELRPGLARSFDYLATGDRSVRPVASDLRPKNACPGVVSTSVVSDTNAIIVYDSHAFADPWLSK